MIVSNLFNRPRIRNETALTLDDLWDNFYSQVFTTYSGESIDPEIALKNIGLVFACVVIRSNAFGKLPLHVFKSTKKSRERDKNHKLDFLLSKRPNNSQSPIQFKKFIETSLLLWGNAYVLQEFDRMGNFKALKPLKPNQVDVLVDDNYENYFYRYTNEKGKITTYSEDEIWHIPYITSDGKVGKAPLTVARENAGNLLSMQRFEGNFYKNGALTQGALATQETLGEEEIDELQKMWASRYAGGDNAGKMPIFHSGIDYKSISMPLKDAEFIMSKKMNKTEIATIFNVPEYMLNNMEKATFNNFEQMKLLYAENVLHPDCTAVEEEINYKAFTTNEMRRYYVKFNMDSALRGDAKTRAEVNKIKMESGTLTPNEARDKEDMDRFDLPEADEPYMTRNLAPLTAIKDNATGGGAGNEEQK